MLQAEIRVCSSVPAKFVRAGIKKQERNCPEFVLATLVHGWGVSKIEHDDLYFNCFLVIIRWKIVVNGAQD